MKRSIFLAHFFAVLLLSQLHTPLHAQASSHPEISFEIDGTTYTLGYTITNSDEYRQANKMNNIRRIIKLSGKENLAQSYEFAREADKKDDPLGAYILALQARYGLGMDQSLDRYIFRLDLAAKKNYPPALFELASAYEHGIGVKADMNISRGYLQKAALAGYPEAMEKRGLILVQAGAYEDALPYLEKAAQAGLAEANFQLGVAYAHGLGVKKDMKQSIAALSAAADKNHVRAMAALLTIYRLGIGVPKSAEKVKELNSRIEVVINGHDLDLAAQYAYRAACQLSRQVIKNDKAALALLRNEAKKGNALGEYNLGLALYSGLGMSKSNPRAAFSAIERAAKKGLKDAMGTLGYYHTYGIGCEVDHKKAVAWLERAAEKDMPNALFLLALGYLHDERYMLRLPRDYKKSLEYFMRAGNLGHASAQNQVAYMLYHGMGRKGTEKEIQEWFEKAGENNFANALFTLGERANIVMHNHKDANGKFKPELRKIMYDYYRRGAELGQIRAMSRLASYYVGYTGNEPDINKRIYWLEVAAEFGDSTSINDLGYIYLQGNGVKKDIPRGLDMLEKNAQTPQGRQAANALADIYSQGQYGVPIDVERAIMHYENARIPTDRGRVPKLVELYIQNSAGKLQNSMKAYELMKGQFSHFQGTYNYLLWLALDQMLKIDDQNFPRLTKEQCLSLASKAEMNDEKAMYQLAVAMLRGDTGQVEPKAALPLLEKLADRGNVDALVDLSLYAQYGVTEPPDMNKTLEYIKKLAEIKTEKAQLFAGLIAYTNLTTPAQRAFASCLDEASKMGNIDSIYVQHKRCTFIKKELKQKAPEVFEELASKGHLASLIEVALQRQNNPKEQIPILEELADRGIGKALDTLYLIYQYGQGGVPRDKEKAAEYERRAIEAGYPETIERKAKRDRAKARRAQ